MSKRSSKCCDDDHSHNHSHGSGSEDEDESPRRVKKEKKSKIKWTGIFLIGLFVVPTVLGVAMYIYDMVFPQDAKMRDLRNPLVRCYSAANPDKLSEIDYLLKKYEGKEHRLYDQVCIYSNFATSNL
jgi:hypothetical protein